RLDTDCQIVGKGRNIDDQHGVTSILSARQLNDLAAFEAAPHGPVGEVRSVSNAALDVQSLQISFGRKPSTDGLTMRGSAKLTQAQHIDPATTGVTVSVGLPRAGHMEMFSRTIPNTLGKTNKAGTSFKFVDKRTVDDHGAPLQGRLTLALKLKAGQLAFRFSGTKLDLATLKTKTPDLTIALEFGEGTAVASTRRYRVNKSGSKIHGPGGGGKRHA